MLDTESKQGAVGVRQDNSRQIRLLDPDTVPQYTEVRFTSFLSGGFIIAIVVNPPERKLEKRTSVHCLDLDLNNQKTRRILSD